MKIRTRLLVLMFCLVAVSLTLTGVLSYRVNSSFLKDAIIAIQKEKTLAAVALIDSFLDIHKQRVGDQGEYVYSLIQLHRSDIIPSLQQFLNSSPFYREESLVQRNGRELARISRHTFYLAGEMRNFSRDELFAKILKDKVYRFKDVHRNEFGEPVIELYYPVLDAKKAVSHVLIHSMNLKPLWDTISEIKLGKTGFAFVVDRQGYVIAHPDFSTVLSNANVSGLTIFKRLVNTKPIRYGEGVVMNVQEGGYFYSGRLSEETGWVVIVRQDSSEANGPLLYIVRALLLGMGIILAFGAAFSIIFSRRFTAPLLILTEGVKNIARGNLDFQAPIRSTDELGELARGFNAMAASLENTTVSRKTLQTILDSMPYGIIIIDREKKIQTANRAALALMGYESEDQIAGMICNKTLCPDEEGKCPILDLKQKLDRSEKILITKGGKRINILKTVVALKLEGKDVLLEAVVDITDRKHAEEQLKRYAGELRESNEELKAFIYSAAHDLRQPLVNIKGFSVELRQSLQELSAITAKRHNLFTPDEQKTIDTIYQKDVQAEIGFIGTSVERMDGLINALLKLSQIGHRVMRPERIDMNALARTVSDSLMHQVRDNNVTLTLGVLPEVVADRTAMEQILSNLLDNAVKYHSSGLRGEVELSGERTENEVVYRVRDNGRGISRDDMPKLFKIFRRLGTQDVPGEGMGLAYVKTLVRLLGGRIWCESEPGVGTTFSFTVPVGVDVV